MFSRDSVHLSAFLPYFSENPADLQKKSIKNNAKNASFHSPLIGKHGKKRLDGLAGIIADFSVLTHG